MNARAGIALSLALVLDGAVAADDPRVGQVMDGANPAYLQNVANWHCMSVARLAGNEPGRVAQMIREYLRASDANPEPSLLPERKCSPYGLTEEHCTNAYLESLPRDPGGQPGGHEKKYLGLRNACESLARRSTSRTGGVPAGTAVQAQAAPAGAGNIASGANLRRITGQREVWSGIYEGQLDWTHVPRLIRKTDRIPARVGLSFGTCFTLLTEPADATGIVRMQYKTVFPAPGLRDPRTGKMIHEVNGVTECIIGKACLAGYTFDTPSEAIPGEWRLTVSFRGEVVMDKTFVVEAAH